MNKMKFAGGIAGRENREKITAAIYRIFWIYVLCGAAYPFLGRKLEKTVKENHRLAMNLFLVFMVTSQLVTGTALLRMHQRQEGDAAQNRVEQVLDVCFTDQRLQQFFPENEKYGDGREDLSGRVKGQPLTGAAV